MVSESSSVESKKSAGCFKIILRIILVVLLIILLGFGAKEARQQLYEQKLSEVDKIRINGPEVIKINELGTWSCELISDTLTSEWIDRLEEEYGFNWIQPVSETSDVFLDEELLRGKEISFTSSDDDQFILGVQFANRSADYLVYSYTPTLHLQMPESIEVASSLEDSGVILEDLFTLPDGLARSWVLEFAVKDNTIASIESAEALDEFGNLVENPNNISIQYRVVAEKTGSTELTVIARLKDEIASRIGKEQQPIVYSIPINTKVYPRELEDVELYAIAGQEVIQDITTQLDELGLHYNIKVPETSSISVSDGVITAIEPGVVKVSVEADKGLRCDITINVSKPALKIVCDNCGIEGHANSECPNTSIDKDEQKVQKSKVISKVTGYCKTCTHVAHKTGDCLNRRTSDDIIGKFSIPSVGIDIKLSAKFNQADCDKPGMGVISEWGVQYVIGDHNYQGFEAIKSLPASTPVYVTTDRGTFEYKVKRSYQGINNGSLWDTNGNPIYLENPGGLSLYTCNKGSYHSVTIVECVPVNGQTQYDYEYHDINFKYSAHYL